jgi:hypothetical protein
VINLKSLDSTIARLKLKADWVHDFLPLTPQRCHCLASRLDGNGLVIQAEKTRWEVYGTTENRGKQLDPGSSQQETVPYSRVAIQETPYESSEKLLFALLITEIPKNDYTDFSFPSRCF